MKQIKHSTPLHLYFAIVKNISFLNIKLEGYSRHSRQPSLNKVLSGLVIANRKSHFLLSKTK